MKKKSRDLEAGGVGVGVYVGEFAPGGVMREETATTVYSDDTDTQTHTNTDSENSSLADEGSVGGCVGMGVGVCVNESGRVFPTTFEHDGLDPLSPF